LISVLKICSFKWEASIASPLNKWVNVQPTQLRF
jgi:hypothetical protein